MSMLPWDMLSGETVRAVIKDLGLSQYTRRVRRTELVKILQEIEADGIETVIQRLQQRASIGAGYVPGREQSPEIAYAGPVGVGQPFVQVPSRPGPGRIHDHGHRPHASNGADSLSAQRPAKKARIPPPSYAILYQMEQEISEPSAAPIPRLRPNEAFEGVVLPPPRRGRRSSAELPSESISQAGDAMNAAESRSDGSSPIATQFAGVFVTKPTEAVRLQWKQTLSGGRSTEG
ncbi:hypothetical protein BD413DRAFT_232679 [Trametes elegans]|nr:hypothetical protein BD413DRAFT_232679 [Trametes elegans]